MGGSENQIVHIFFLLLFIWLLCLHHQFFRYAYAYASVLFHV